MKKIIVCSMAAMMSLAADFASARNIWRECGIGGMIFKDTGWAAITSNIIWDLGTTATSSNASSDDLCEGSTASTAKFINASFANLEEEVASGKGSHLTAMLNMLGCEKAKHQKVISALRSDLFSQMSDANYSSQPKTVSAENFFNSTLYRAESAQCRSI